MDLKKKLCYSRIEPKNSPIKERNGEGKKRSSRNKCARTGWDDGRAKTLL